MNNKNRDVKFSFSYNDIIDAYSKCENNKDTFKDNLYEIYNKENNLEDFEKIYRSAERTLQREGIYMKFKDEPYLLLMDVRKDNFVRASYNNDFLLNSSENNYDYYIKYYPVMEFMDGSEEYIQVTDIAVVDNSGIEEAFTADTLTEGIRGRFKADDYFIPVKEEDIPVKIKDLDIMPSFIELEMDVIKGYEDNERGYSFDDLYKLEVSNIEDIVYKAREVKNNLNCVLGSDIKIEKDRVIISDRMTDDNIKINSEYDYDKVNNELYMIIKNSGLSDFESLKKEISESSLDTSLIDKEYSEVSELGLNDIG